MAGFKGRANAAVDTKGRVSLPAKYRKLLPEDLVLAKRFDEDIPTLVLYTNDGYDQYVDQILEDKGGFKASSIQMSDLEEKLLGAAYDVSLDGNGRINIHANLIRDAKIQKEVVITGLRDHFVIRSLESQEAYDNQRLAPLLVFDN